MGRDTHTKRPPSPVAEEPAPASLSPNWAADALLRLGHLGISTTNVHPPANRLKAFENCCLKAHLAQMAQFGLANVERTCTICGMQDTLCVPTLMWLQGNLEWPQCAGKDDHDINVNVLQYLPGLHVSTFDAVPNAFMWYMWLADVGIVTRMGGEVCVNGKKRDGLELLPAGQEVKVVFFLDK